MSSPAVDWRGKGLLFFLYLEVQAWYAEQGVPEFDQPFMRELTHPPFRIVYRRDPQRVRIVRVWRSERLLHVPAADDEVPTKT